MSYKGVDILNERGHLPFSLCPRDALSSASVYERLPDDLDQGAVSRKEYRWRPSLGAQLGVMNCIQAGESFPGPWHTSHKAYSMITDLLCFADVLYYYRGSLSQIVSITVRYLSNIMLGKKTLCCLNNCKSWPIRSNDPTFSVNQSAESVLGTVKCDDAVRKRRDVTDLN